jgi:hypothetical protein
MPAKYTKRCKACKRYKHLSMFNKQKRLRSKDGRVDVCSTCRATARPAARDAGRTVMKNNRIGTPKGKGWKAKANAQFFPNSPSLERSLKSGFVPREVEHGGR